MHHIIAPSWENSYLGVRINSRLQKKRDILSEKRESRMALKKREFTPESGNVATYGRCRVMNRVRVSRSLRIGQV